MRIRITIQLFRFVGIVCDILGWLIVEFRWKASCVPWSGGSDLWVLMIKCELENGCEKRRIWIQNLLTISSGDLPFGRVGMWPNQRRWWTRRTTIAGHWMLWYPKYPKSMAPMWWPSTKRRLRSEWRFSSISICAIHWRRRQISLWSQLRRCPNSSMKLSLWIRPLAISATHRCVEWIVQAHLAHRWPSDRSLRCCSSRFRHRWESKRSTGHGEEERWMNKTRHTLLSFATYVSVIWLKWRRKRTAEDQNDGTDDENHSIEHGCECGDAMALELN